MLVFHSFYNEKIAPHETSWKSNKKTTAIIGFDTKIMAPGYDFFTNFDSYMGFFTESGYSLGRDQNFALLLADNRIWRPIDSPGKMSKKL